MKEKKSTWWDRRSLEDVKQSWDIGDWTAANQVAYLLGRLAQSRAICVNGKYRDANNIPTKFVEILWCNWQLGSSRSLWSHQPRLYPILPSAEERRSSSLIIGMLLVQDTASQIRFWLPITARCPTGRWHRASICYPCPSNGWSNNHRHHWSSHLMDQESKWFESIWWKRHDVKSLCQPRPARWLLLLQAVRAQNETTTCDLSAEDLHWLRRLGIKKPRDGLKMEVGGRYGWYGWWGRGGRGEKLKCASWILKTIRHQFRRKSRNKRFSKGTGHYLIQYAVRCSGSYCFWDFSFALISFCMNWASLSCRPGCVYFWRVATDTCCKGGVNLFRFFKFEVVLNLIFFDRSCNLRRVSRVSMFLLGSTCLLKNRLAGWFWIKNGRVRTRCPCNHSNVPLAPLASCDCLLQIREAGLNSGPPWAAALISSLKKLSDAEEFSGPNIPKHGKKTHTTARLWDVDVPSWERTYPYISHTKALLKMIFLFPFSPGGMGYISSVESRCPSGFPMAGHPFLAATALGFPKLGKLVWRWNRVVNACIMYNYCGYLINMV